MRAEQLIKDIRIGSDNVDSSAISDDEILRYINNAQDRLQSLIMQEHPESDIFSMQGHIFLSYGLDRYSLKDLADLNGNKIPQKLFAGNCVSMVEISQNFSAITAANLREYPNLASFPILGETGYTYVDTSTGKNYRWQGASYIEVSAAGLSYNFIGTWLPLVQVSPRERTVGFGYFLRGDDIIIAPMPATLNVVVRVTGMRRLSNIDKRRGKIVSSSIVGGKVVLNLSGVPSDTTFDSDTVTIVDKNGNLAQYTDPTTGKVTYFNGLEVVSYVAPNLTIDLASIPDFSNFYLVYGDLSTSHPEIDDFCMRYLVESSIMRIFMRDSSRDMSAQSGLLSAIEREIMDTYAGLGNDAALIPVVTTDYLYY